VAGGTIFRDVIDIYPRPRPPRIATLRRKRIEAFLGAPVDDGIVDGIFERLGFKAHHTKEGWSIDVPSHRLDITREEDLLEEIARHHGFDKFPTSLPKWAGYGSALPLESKELLLRNRLAAAGYSEIIPMAFSDESTERKFRANVEPVRLLNPMAEDEAVLRTSLVPSMLKTIEWNANRGIRDVRLYELGKVYGQQGERRTLIMAATGTLRSKSVHEPERNFDFYDVKGDVEDIFETFGLALGSVSDPLPAYYHPGRALRDGDLAACGELHPEYAAAYKFRQRVYIAEVDIDLILESSKSLPIATIPKFPAIRRDFSLLLSKGTRYADVERVIRSQNVPELAAVEPFDRLDIGPFPESKYALAISLKYQSLDRTLTDEEVERFDAIILNSLKQHLNAELRQ
jgi:phenylalanyl-tRNA synthetase beta chain